MDALRAVSVSKTATLIVTAKSAGDGDDVSVLVLGDSTTANGTAVTKLAGNFADDPMSITLCGTKGTSPYLHEGRSGWTFYNYVNTSSDNAFYNPSTNKFDADYYFTNTGVEKPDWFFINLGINDTYGSVNDREVIDECSKIKDLVGETVLYHRENGWLEESEGISVYIPFSVDNFHGLLKYLDYIC